ncbi:MAG TPA: glycogen synthase GlgA [Anaeromyxobacter sp.]|nr:glycogen synthase GlgA [Anaeromyxobacter sp.]
MEILFVASEVAPWSKTGGLGDVVGALPRALAARGHAVSVVSPRYYSIDVRQPTFTPLHRAVSVRGEPTTLWLHQAGGVSFYFVENDRYFASRRGLYGDAHGDFGDNAERFAYLSRAGLAAPAALGLRPRILHLNDWQTGLLPFLLRHEHDQDPAVARARTVFTIHNLAYQGLFPKHVVPLLGLPWSAFRYDAMEFYDHLSFMKAALTFSDALTTVSPTYAREILTPEGGARLDPVLRHRQGDLTGILNGIDVEEWDPSKDPHLPAHFDVDHLEGKAVCKAELQRELKLPVRPEVPLIGMVGRLAEQKGIDLVAAVLPRLSMLDIQLVVLGSGERALESVLVRASRTNPSRVAARIGFDEGLAHRIEAGADLFLMPSRFEPCGLNQMYSLRYGTVPVVRAVGGLADTVEDQDGAERGTGFQFREYHPAALFTALSRALLAFGDRAAWRGLMRRGMAQDNSWDRSAAGYEAVYRRLLG